MTTTTYPHCDMKTLHPALALYAELFQREAAAGNNIETPTHWVKRNCFHAECRRRGIKCPDGFVDAVAWEESIGLTEFAHKVVAGHHKAHGTDFTPMEKGAWRLYRKMKKH